MVRTVKKLHYSLLLYDVVKLTSTQMVICNCEHIANLKKLCYSFGNLHCGPTDFHSKDHYLLRTTQMVIDNCEHVANSKKVHDSLLFYNVVKLT